VIVEHHRNAGDASMGQWLMQDVLDCFPEMTWVRDRDTALREMVLSTESIPRVELIAFHGKRPVGLCILVYENDPHVGDCLGIQWNFVLPAYRGYVGHRFLRRAIQLARGNGLKVLAYTHRTGLGQYAVHYRRI